MLDIEGLRTGSDKQADSMTDNEFRDTLRARLLAECPEADLHRWFDPLDMALDQPRATVDITFPHVFFASRFPQSFRDVMEKELRGLLEDSTVPVAVRYSDRPAARPPVALQRNQTPETDSPWQFDTFIAGGRHKGVLHVLRDDLARSPYLYCPVVLGGPSGTGKTHLLRATAHQWSARHQDVGLYTAETLTALVDQCGQSGQNGQAGQKGQSGRSGLWQLQEKLQSHQLLGLDNVHNLPLTDPLQNMVAALIDFFAENHKPMLLAGTGRPAHWPLMESLRSRLEQGLWFELAEPDLDLRFRFAQAKARQLHLALGKEHLLTAAQRCPDLRRLAGLIRRFVSHSQLTGRDLNERDISNILQQSHAGTALTPQTIIACVSERCGVPPKDIMGEVRRPDLVQARQLAMFLCREQLGYSYPVIGRLFGGKDHSTVMHGVKKIKQLQERDNVMHSLVTELTNDLQRQRE